MAYDNITDSYMSDEDYRKLLKERKREKNRERHWQTKEKRDRALTISAPLDGKANKERIAEFKRQLLHAPTGGRIIGKVIEIAMNDGHPGQMAAIKICMDRLLPVSLFDEKSGMDRPQISITISGIEPVEKVINEG